MTLKVASNIHTQDSVLKTVGTMKGSKIAARVMREKRNLRCRSNASPMPSPVLNTVATAVKNMVFLNAVQNIWLPVCLT